MSVVPDPVSSRGEDELSLTLAGQRKINLVWEFTQAAIAIFVVASTVCTGAWMAIIGSNAQPPTILSALCFTVVGFYFSRTDHAAIGGIGPKPTGGVYTGR